MEVSPKPPVTRLVPDILLDIFDLLVTEESSANLVSCMLCCQRWKPLAASVLYRHVVLDHRRLALFVENHMSCQLSSLTIKMKLTYTIVLSLSPDFDIADSFKMSLQKLRGFIKDIMPTSVSISTTLISTCPITPEIAALVDALPESCTALEIGIWYYGILDHLMQANAEVTPGDFPHLCDSVRTILPRLHHLRLRLPTLCASLFCCKPSQEQRCQVVQAPLLQTCLISLSLCHPLDIPHLYSPMTAKCREDHKPVYCYDPPRAFSPALVKMEKVLTEFSHLNAGTLKRIWTMETRPARYNETHMRAAWVRRDFLSNKSYLIPVWGFTRDSRRIRVPSLRNPEITEDIVVRDLDHTESIAEGGTWVTTHGGTRISAWGAHNYMPAHLASPVSRDGTGGMSEEVQLNDGPPWEITMPHGPGELMQLWYGQNHA